MYSSSLWNKGSTNGGGSGFGRLNFGSALESGRPGLSFGGERPAMLISDSKKVGTSVASGDSRGNNVKSNSVSVREDKFNSDGFDLADGLSALSIKRQKAPKLEVPDIVYKQFRMAFENHAVGGKIMSDLFFGAVIDEMSKGSLLSVPQEVVAKIISELSNLKRDCSTLIFGTISQAHGLRPFSSNMLSWEKIMELIVDNTCLEVKGYSHFKAVNDDDNIPYESPFKKMIYTSAEYTELLRNKGIEYGLYIDQDRDERTCVSPLKVTEFRQLLKSKEEIHARARLTVDPAAVKRVERLRAQPVIDELVESRRRPLSAKQIARANAAFVGNDQDLMIDKFNIDISRRKIRGLMPGQWLNDENINFYMELLKARDASLCEKAKSEGGFRKPSHFFNSIFMGFLNTGNDYNYGKVKRWTKKIPTSIFDLRRIYCPINIRNTHWTLAVVHMDIKEIRYYDSMNGGGKMYMASLLRWLKDEANDKLQKEYDTSDWKCVPQVDIPQQHNGFDCGMFTILNCDFMSDDLPLNEESFSQKDMADFRLKTVIKILDGELSYPLINNVLSE